MGQLGNCDRFKTALIILLLSASLLSLLGVVLSVPMLVEEQLGVVFSNGVLTWGPTGEYELNKIGLITLIYNLVSCVLCVVFLLYILKKSRNTKVLTAIIPGIFAWVVAGSCKRFVAYMIEHNKGTTHFIAPVDIKAIVVCVLLLAAFAVNVILLVRKRGGILPLIVTAFGTACTLFEFLLVYRYEYGYRFLYIDGIAVIVLMTVLLLCALPQKNLLRLAKKNPVEALQLLEKQRKDGVITEEAYQSKRMEILRSLQVSV